MRGPAAAEANPVGVGAAHSRPPPWSPPRPHALPGSCFPSARDGRTRSSPRDVWRKEERRRCAPAEGVPRPALRGPCAAPRRATLGTEVPLRAPLRQALAAPRPSHPALCRCPSVIQVWFLPCIKQTRNPRSGKLSDLPKVAQRAVTKQTHICDSRLPRERQAPGGSGHCRNHPAAAVGALFSWDGDAPAPPPPPPPPPLLTTKASIYPSCVLFAATYAD
nr:uncharacterized protein LOC117794817 [Marmota flaviventris]